MAQDKKQVEQITDMEVDFAKWFTDVCGTLGGVCSHVSQGTGKFGSRP